MSKKLVISLLLLMLIASLIAYFKLSHHSLEFTPTHQIPSIELLPKEKIKPEIEDKSTTTTDIEIKAINTKINNSPDEKGPKIVDRLEIRGSITNYAGEGIADVLIFAKGEFPPTHTDANGNYHIVFERSGFTDLHLNISLNGYEKQKNIITVNEFKKSPIIKRNVTLIKSLDTQTKTSFGGKVSNLIGEGLADQRIHLITLGDYSDTEDRYIEVALTNENGYFTLNDISINTYYQLIVLDGNGYASFTVDDLLVTNHTPDLDIILQYRKFTNKSGLVIDIEGVPMPNLEVKAYSVANNKYSRNLMTDNSGGFQLVDFPEGEASFSIKSPADIKISGIKLTEMDAQTIILTVDSGNHFLSGVVSDSDGQVIEDARVTLQSTHSKNDVDSLSLRSVITDSTGTFAFENFGADEHILIIVSKGFKQHMIVHQTHSSDTYLSITLERH